MGSTYRARAFLVLLAAAGLAVAASCRSATQVTLRITSELGCDKVKGVAVTAGVPGALEGLDPGTVTYSCADADGGGSVIGTIVVVPSVAPDARVGVKVVLGSAVDVRDCTAATGYAGCIVARRTFRFIEYAGFYLPIELRERCVGIACQGDETCVQGLCKPAEVDLEKSGCTADEACGDATLFGAGGGGGGGDGSVTLDPKAAWATTAASAQRNRRAKGTLRKSAPPAPWKPLWSVPGEVDVDGGMTIGADGTVYASTGRLSGRVRAVSPTGMVKWVSGLSSRGGPAVLSNGTLLLSTGRYLDMNTGSEVGVPEALPSGVPHPFAVSSDGTEFTSVANSLVAIRNGKQVWSKVVDIPLSAVAVAPDGKRVFATLSSGLLSVEAALGMDDVGWAYGTHQASLRDAPAVADDGTVFVGGEGHGVFVLAPALTNPHWTEVAGQPLRSTPAIGRTAGGDFAVYCAGAALMKLANFAVSPIQYVTFSASEPCRAQTAPLVDAEGNVLVTMADLTLAAFSGDGGKLLWKLAPPKPLSASTPEPAVIGADGTVYLLLEDGALVAYR